VRQTKPRLIESSERQEWRSAFSEAAEKSPAINTERGLSASTMCDIVNQTLLMPLKTVG
jgi:hypothetical protein